MNGWETVKTAIYLVGVITGFLLFYWRIAKTVSVWERDIEQLKEQYEVMDQKVDELIVHIAVLNTQIKSKIYEESKV